MHHLRLGVYQIVSYFHEWIAETGTLSCHGKIMKKEMEKEDTLEGTYGAEEIR